MGDGILSGFWFNLRARAQREQRGPSGWVWLAGMVWVGVVCFVLHKWSRMASKLIKGRGKASSQQEVWIFAMASAAYRATLVLHFSSRLKKGQFLGLRTKNGIVNTHMSNVLPFHNLNLKS
ncbi:hypothetical protein PanWU01x14_073870 [Parasponia andersonii]|uniref:Transmembrane protein n=1 Tax=Parasponia andersonii TaxID=3476 RepID=A0A2P5DDA3_PARAD|nr:hypothetical protein PanWU01x14_073870 [Parasponia andersonii]